jgi:hypothetical protein
MSHSIRSTLLAGAAICLVAATPALAQNADNAATSVATGQISGVVIDRNGNLVGGATVRVEGSNVVETTDGQGRFTLRGVSSGEQQIRVRYFGVEDVVQTVSVTPGQPTTVNISLTPPTSADGQIVVSASRPIAESEAAALQLQRSSASLVSVIAADSIGRFPDQNIAASLARLPGIAVQRDQGQDRFVSLRGARTSWTTVSFDGINVISPAGRETRFDTIPATLPARWWCARP